MIKKALVPIFTLLVVVMLAIPMVGLVQACRPRFGRCQGLSLIANNRMNDPNTDPPGYTLPATTEYFGPKIPELVSPNNPDGHKYMLMKGAVLFGVISCEPLGEGTMTSNQICHLVNQETGVGYGLYMFLWEFNNDKCVGTIKGILRTRTTTAFPEISIVGEPRLSWGTGDLEGVIIKCAYNAINNLITRMTIGEFVGTIWNWFP